LVEHSPHTRVRQLTQTPIASRCWWFSQVATAAVLTRCL
jgi:hypothetical protein